MRPVSVTVVGWWLIVTSLLGVYSSLTINSNPFAVEMASRGPIPLEVQQIFGMVNGFVLAICGIVILKGRTWARALFLGWSAIGFLFGIFIVGILLALLFSMISVGMIMFFLCRQRANEWFSSAP